jgi:hypothetical protein
LLFYTIRAKNKLGRVNGIRPWIIIRGSYASTIAAWFRSKYPHLTIEALESSGVVLAV